MPLLYGLYAFSMRLALLALSRWQVVQEEPVPKSGGLILVANHLSMLDPLLIWASFPRRVVFLAKEEFFRSPLTRWAFQSAGAIPLRRGRPDRGGLRQAEQMVEKGHVVGVFPEGTRSRSGQLQRAHAGVAILALETGAPIVPVAISGTEGNKGLQWLLSRPTITVRIGRPFHLPIPEGRLTGTQLIELADLIMRDIAALLPETYRGVYRDRAASLRPHVQGPDMVHPVGSRRE